ncbi:SDR family NAD(P)-dependent oxidoreductase [Candidatus Uabimicrobium amorphum]|uniref:Short-chain dehydrogenase n=1 Tax=Uabimicrobium amorphum TaxID=2596890 RepID=A0A5S9F7N9_UABAM|nr:SDR family NAD(P)-dependent oxidoreductase [Candidatus Uabimicrobium amorphum]BBM87939.1 short-chain dehydrogenase [Candidatus Uabimicrobium amorphum]
MSKSYMVITGGSQGIGFEIARNFAKKGENIVIIARNEERLQSARDRLREYHDDIQYLSVDLSVESAGIEAIQHIRQNWGEINTLVLNHAILHNRLFSQSSLANIEKEWRTNFLTPVAMLKQLIPLWQKKRYGKVIVVGSLTALVPFPGNASYAATKGALLALIRSIRIELQNYGIQASIVLPGLTRTSMSKEMQSPFVPTLSPQQVAKSVDKVYRTGKGVVIPGKLDFVSSIAFQLFPTTLEKIVQRFAKYLLPAYYEQRGNENGNEISDRDRGWRGVYREATTQIPVS